MIKEVPGSLGYICGHFKQLQINQPQSSLHRSNFVDSVSGKGNTCGVKGSSQLGLGTLKLVIFRFPHPQLIGVAFLGTGLIIDEQACHVQQKVK